MKLKAIILALVLALTALSAGAATSNAQNNSSSPAPGMDGLDWLTFSNTCSALGGVPIWSSLFEWKCITTNPDGTKTTVTCDAYWHKSQNCRTTSLIKKSWRTNPANTSTGAVLTASR